MGYPQDFTYAFGKLEQAIEELVAGKGAIKSRLDTITKTMAPIFPEDFPESLREEYRSISEALAWIPPEEGSNQGLADATLEAMTEDEAGSLAERLFSLYLAAADIRREG